jgi:protein involved in polysaccharide export with SLBB domain
MKHSILFLLSLLAIALPRVHAETFRDGDVCEMRLSGPPEEFTREFNLVLTVDQGAVTIPLIGRIPARGLTSSGLATVIENRLKQAKIFTIANVNITVNGGNERNRTIIVGGSVRQSGRQPWIADLTLTGAISAAQGRSDFAKDGIKVIRNGKVQQYSWKALKRDPSLDPKILSGDIIDVEGD